MERYDYITIGGGSGGISSANRAAEYGAKALIIEKRDVGGTCVNRGCVPKKISWHGTMLREQINDYASAYGLDFEEKGPVNYTELKNNRDAYIQRVHKGYASGFQSRGTHYLEGEAKFIDNHTVEVNGELYTAPHISIVTGGRPRLVDLPGIDLVDTSDDFFEWTTLPESVIIIGAGYVATEFAGVLNGLGVKTTQAVRYDRPLRAYDADIVEVLVDQMTKSGINLLTNHDVASIEKVENDQLQVNFKNGETAVADKVIYAIGRTPNTDKIGLENTDVALTASGHVQVDDYHHTNVEGIYAFGDVIGKVELTPVAIMAGRTLSDTLFNGAEPYLLDYNTVPTVIFTHPAIGSIGYSEEGAKEAFGEENVKVYKSNFTPMYSAVSEHRQPARMKLVTTGADEKVVGVHGIGYAVEEMMQGFAVGVRLGLTKKQFDQTIAIHPTGAEEFVTMR
ncbi:MAG: glutathione-disulfide reductase [Aerococcus viridans]|nr:MAG: glutathione-disulfide reductase [Aerococcus viridans]